MTASLGVTFALLAALLGGPLEQTVLQVPGRVISSIPADVNGDRESDILVFWRQGYPPNAQTRISVFFSELGKIESKATQVLTLPPWAVAFDVGAIHEDEKADVLILAADGVWVFNSGPEGVLEDNPAQVVAVMTVAAMPNEDHLPRMNLLHDLDSHGRKGLLIPTIPIGPMSLYERGEKGCWTLRQVLRVPTRFDIHTAAEDFRALRDFEVMIQFSFPRIAVADQNADKRWDLFFFCQDSVAVFRALPDGMFSKEPDLYRTVGLLNSRERINSGVLVRGEVGDINGDERADLLFYKTVGGIKNMRSELRLYLARTNADYPKVADFVKKRKGFASSAKLLDIDGDGRDDLVWPYVEIGLSTMIQMMLAGKLDLSFELYLSKEGKLSPIPSSQISSSLGINFFSNQELTGPYPIFDQDFNSDGVLDLVVGYAGGGSGGYPDRLEIRLGEGRGKYSNQAAWQIPWLGSRFLLPFRVRKTDPPSLLLYFASGSRLQGDVWVLQNTGPWQ